MDRARLKHLLVGEFSLKRCLRSAVFVYICVLIYAFFRADHLLFPNPPSSYRDTAEIIKLRTDDGLRISALHLVNPQARFTVLYSHGNGEDLGTLRPFLEEYRRRGFSILAYDYHGYGTSAGQPTEKNVYRDVKAAFAYLVQTAGVPSEQIIVHGRSVGGGAAIYLAARETPAALIAESSFVSAFRVMTHVPLSPIDKFENITRIKKVHCPALIIHGTDDRTIPFWHGEKLFASANEPKFRLWVERAGHDDVDLVAQEQYWNAVNRLADAAAAEHAE